VHPPRAREWRFAGYRATRDSGPRRRPWGEVVSARKMFRLYVVYFRVPGEALPRAYEYVERTARLAVAMVRSLSTTPLGAYRFEAHRVRRAVAS
jgi:hypothetical protein